MALIRFEKRDGLLPSVLLPDTIYFVKDINDKLRLYVSDNQGRNAISTEVVADPLVLVSTPKIEILNNRILLPSKPEGDLVFNMMLVFDMNGILTEYGNVSIEYEGGLPYAVLEETYTVTGFGVVSYMIKAGANV